MACAACVAGVTGAAAACLRAASTGGCELPPLFTACVVIASLSSAACWAWARASAEDCGICGPLSLSPGVIPGGVWPAISCCASSRTWFGSMRFTDSPSSVAKPWIGSV